MINKSVIAKDRCITKLLKQLSKFTGADITLKGGSSLIKGYKITGRMSEDVDLVFNLKNNSNNKKERNKVSKSIIKLIEEVFQVSKGKPKGGGGNHYSAVLEEKLEGETIKLDLSFSNYKVENKKMDIYELNNDMELKRTEIKFQVANLCDTFYDKIFSFQNKTYTELFKPNTPWNFKKTNWNKNEIDDAEKKLTKITSIDLKRLARHAYDITVIYKKEFIKIDFIEEKKKNELNKHIVAQDGKKILKSTYENDLFDFLIFNRPVKIKEWLISIDNEFVDLDVDKVISGLEEIKDDIKNEYNKSQHKSTQEKTSSK